MSARLQVLVTCPQMQRMIAHFRARLDEAGIDVELPPVVQALSESELLEVIGRFDGMIAGDDEITAAVIEAGTHLRTIAKWGVGVDGIDLEAAEQHGIVVTNTPGTFGEEVADVAMGYVVLLARRLHDIDASVKTGGWDKPVGISISGTTLGVIGLGSIGQAVVRRGIGFGMTVLGSDVSPEMCDAAENLGAKVTDLDDVFSESRFVALCCPLTGDTYHLVDRRRLGLMAPDAFLVNTARGPLVDEAALADALESGKLAGAALDVFESEPVPAQSRLRHSNVIFGSHNGSNTAEATLRVSAMAVDNLIAEFERAVR